MSRTTTKAPASWEDGLSKLAGSQASFNFYAHWCAVMSIQRAVVDGNFDSFGQVWRTLDNNRRRNQYVLWVGEMTGEIANFKVVKGELQTVKKSTREGVDDIITGLKNEAGDALHEDFVTKLALDSNHVFTYKQPKAEGTKKFYASEVVNRVTSTLKRFANPEKYEGHRPEDAEFLAALREKVNETISEMSMPATPEAS